MSTVPTTNPTPWSLLHDQDNVTDTNAHKPMRISSSNTDWVILSVYVCNDGHITLDIEPQKEST